MKTDLNIRLYKDRPENRPNKKVRKLNALEVSNFEVSKCQCLKSEVSKFPSLKFQSVKFEGSKNVKFEVSKCTV